MVFLGKKMRFGADFMEISLILDLRAAGFWEMGQARRGKEREK